MEHIKDCIAALREAAPEIDIAENELMRRHTTFAIGGPADLFVHAEDPQGTDRARLPCCASTEHSVAAARQRLEYAGGSDEGVRGAVVCTSELDEVRVGEDNTVYCRGGRAAQPHCTPRTACRSDRSGVCRRHSGQSGRRGIT